METYLEILLDHGSLGVFAAFLIWLYRTQQARMDALVDKFQEQLERKRQDQKSDVENLRQRYDSVISGYNEERSQMRTNIKERLDKLISLCDNIDSKLTSILIRQETANSEIDEIKSQIDLGLESFKTIQQEQRLRELAKLSSVPNTTGKTP